MRPLPSRSLTIFLAALFSATALVAQEPRLANISTRAQTGAGSAVLTAGFVIGPGPDKPVLIRAIGPTLSGFGVSGSLADPVLTVFNSAGAIIATNDNWGGTTALSSAFTSVGAFPLTAASKDSAVVATLAPGNYTAQVAGVGTATGIALVEVYEIGGTGAKLLNTSTRLQISATSTPIIGIVVTPGTGTRKLLLRAAGPALAAFGLTGTLADPSLKLTTSTGAIIATNDDWSTSSATTAADAALLSAVFTQAGAFAFPASSKDAAILADLPPGNYGIQVTGAGTSSGLALVEVYDVTPATTPVVTLAATKPTSDESGNNPGEFTFTRTGDPLFPLTINYGVGGSAVNGVDYPPLVGFLTFPSGASSVKLPLSPNPDVQNEGLDTVVLTLTAGTGYTVGAQASATVTIADSPATLYVAQLRPETGAFGSIASGTASILLSSSGTLAAINITFSNLSSSQVSAHLRISPSGDFVFNLPAGQVSGTQWTFFPTGTYTSAALLDALKSGNIFVGIDTVNYPSGEVRGAFIAGAGSQAFTAPVAPPAVSLVNVTATDAARFLAQTTFGPKKSEIDALTGGSITAWIDQQIVLPFTSHRAATIADRTTYGGSPSITNWNAIHLPNRQNAWFKTVLTAPDQLRQRVAFALSEIFVVSDVSLGEDSHTEPLANYYDLLGNGAFGNFRTLLENVTLSPMMGLYLSSLRNSKADPVTGQTPDENYAREVMQLFTIGLQQLQPDGTLQLAADGLPIPTYNQTTISEVAKVFTGWAYPSTNLTQFRTASTNYFSPMGLFPTSHDDTVKNIFPVSPTPIAANQGGTKDLQLALDALFTHQNTGPFISKLLIQRLVTSNPSPAYVYRVAQKFANNGSGVRGDLGAVVRAILTDYEARSPALVSNLSYGKLKEPLLRLTGLLRTFNASARNGRFAGYQQTIDGATYNSTAPNPNDQSRVASNTNATYLYNAQGNFAQAALRSATVFNFFLPGYVVPGPLAAAGLVAPEFQITDDTYSILVPNYLRGFIVANNTATTVTGNATLVLDLTYEQSLLATPTALLDHLALVLAGGNLPAAARTRITAALAALPATATNLDRAQTAVLVLATSPAGSVQK